MMPTMATVVQREMAGIGQVVYAATESVDRMACDADRMADMAVAQASVGDWQGFHRGMNALYQLRDAVAICHGDAMRIDRVIAGALDRVDVVMAISTQWMASRG